MSAKEYYGETYPPHAPVPEAAPAAELPLAGLTGLELAPVGAAQLAPLVVAGATGEVLVTIPEVL